MFGMISDLVGSFYSRQFYAGVAHDRAGIGAGLIFLLTLVMYVSLAPWQLYEGVKDTVSTIPAEAQTMPDLTFKDGKVSMNKPSPFYIHFGPQGYRGSIVIDTQYSVSDVDKLAGFMRDNHIFMLVTENKIVTLKGRQQNEIDIVDMKPAQNVFSVTHAEWVKWGNVAAAWGAVAIFSVFTAMFLVLVFVSNLVISLIAGLAVKVVSIVFRSDLTYMASVRVASAFRIPAYVICSLPLLAGLPRLVGSASWAVWCIYLVIGVYSSKYDS